MAAVQYSGGKCHGASEAKAMIRHACADERVRHTHSNQDIDQDRTSENTDIRGLSYQQMCDVYDERIEGYRKSRSKALRKDAVTMYDLIISKPGQLPACQEDAWYRDVADVIDRHYGAKVVLDIKIHRDEIHEYTDVDTGKRVMSRTHGHAFVFPEIDGRLCAKSFSSRRHMRELNREIDDLTRERYHCAFLTGEHSVDRSFQSVEQLKRRSDEMAAQTKAMQERQTIERQITDMHREQAQQATDTMLQQANDELCLRAIKARIKRLEKQKSELEQNVKRLQQQPEAQAIHYHRVIEYLCLEDKLQPYIQLYDVEHDRLDMSVQEYKDLADKLHYDTEQPVLDRLESLEQEQAYERDDDEWER
jgi:hypothetical protein